MNFVVTHEDRTSFRRCKRQWDFGSLERRNLVPARPAAEPGTGQAVRDALNIYYFPGMWDWDRSITLPLVTQGFDRAMAGQRQRCGAGQDEEPWPQRLETGRRLLDRYTEWAPDVDGFSPVMVAPEYEVTVPDPAQPDLSLVTPAGARVRYRGRIDMLAVDASDNYWIVRHREVAGDWPATEELLDDEEAAAACWAWENFYPGMTITGTIYNEFRLPPPGEPGSQPAPPATEAEAETTPEATEAAATAEAPQEPEASEEPEAPEEPEKPEEPAGRAPRLSRLVRYAASALRSSLSAIRRETPKAVGRVGQHEPSGGGRSVPMHRRLYAAASEPKRVKRVVQHTGDGFRRTLVRRSPEEIDAAWRRLAADASMMITPDLAIEAAPSDENCPPCPFRAPCEAMSAGEDAEAILRSDYRERPPVIQEEGRLGGGSWGQSRGAAPVHFKSDQVPGQRGAPGQRDTSRGH